MWDSTKLMPWAFLLIMCFNDFPHYLSRSSPNMYIDDTTLTYSTEDIETPCDDLTCDDLKRN